MMEMTEVEESGAEVERLLQDVRNEAPGDRRDLLKQEPPALIAAVLSALPVLEGVSTLRHFPEVERNAILDALPDVAARAQWELNLDYPDESIGELMQLPAGIVSPGMTAAEAIEEVREMTKKAFITYGFAIDEEGKLKGILVMRDLMLADPQQLVAEIMLTNPFSLNPEMRLMDAMKLVLNRHYPVYPVCDADGRLVGVVRGQSLFEQQAVEISLMAGSMVGVEKEERLSTPLRKSFFFRHPWLQLNLLTAFVAAGVVGAFEGTLDQIVILAVFLPVLAGQSGNTGCQALAVALRGMTLGETARFGPLQMMTKEALLGLFNGALVGVIAGIGMAVYANMTGAGSPLALGLIVFFAMTGSCVISGVFGAGVPLVLKKLGADPATASSIFLTTATDVFSMGIFLGLATWMLL